MTNPIDRLNAALGGRYRIERELGAGGMATVYLADDLKHQRKVAIKVLKPELAAVVGADRFLAEIETTANLQHPHILPLFDSGAADGFLFYVMPYVEGESLRDRLDREQQLPVDEAVRIASDVAEALHAAHERGVIHRDIKPANILLSGGRPLVADFGIALAVSNAGGGRLTETGLSMGTPYYMSPEQASADRDPTPASDQYSLSCVLYEMLVGEPPFPGGSAQAVLARILTGDPTPPSATRKSVPANVDAVVMRGLEKLPADRFPDAREMVRALRDDGHRYTTGSNRTMAAGSSRTLGTTLPWALAAVLALVAAAGWLTRGDSSATADPIRVAVPLAADSEVPLGPLLRLGNDALPFDVSSDGRTLFHLGWDGDEVRIYSRSLDSYASVVLPGTEDALDPFLSPDGRWVGFTSGGSLWKVPVDGGEPQRLAAAPNSLGGFWGDDDRIWFTTEEGTRLTSVSAQGGGVTVHETRNDGMIAPSLIPNGAGLALGTGSPTMVAVWTEESGIRLLTPGVTPQVLPSGYVTFVLGRTLYAAGFDLDALELTTTPVPVLEGVRSSGWYASYRVANNGTLYFVPGEDASVVSPALIDPQGRADTLPMPPAEYGHLAISPDLTRIVTYEVSNEFELSIFDVASGRAQRIDQAVEISQAIWSRAGDRIAYGRRVAGDGPYELVVRSPGSTRETVLVTSEHSMFPTDWSPDDSELLYGRGSDDLGLQTFRIDVSEGAEPEPLLTEATNDWGAVLSPDGRWIAYTSDRDGSYEVYVAPWPLRADEGAVKISAHSGSEEPHWSFDGQAVGYRSGGRWWWVPLSLGASATPGEPELIAEGSFVNVPGKSWDLLPDGRLLVGDAPRDRTSAVIHMIPNFVSEIEARLAGGS